MTSRTSRGRAPPIYVSRELGAKWVGISLDEWDARVESGKLPAPALDWGGWLSRWDSRKLPWIRPPEPAAMSIPGVVYFIQCGEFVKLGFTTDLGRRLSGYLMHTPYDVKVLASMPGDRRLEKSLHRRFVKHHHRGEWFRLSSEILDYINDLPRH